MGLKASAAFIAVFPACIAFMGCAPTAHPDMAKEIEGFELPGAKERPEGMAGVYVSRPGGPGGFVRFNVFVENPLIDSLEAGSTKGGQHIRFSINPGRHRLYSIAENTAMVERDFKADSVYFFRQDPRMGLLLARNELVETDSIEGVYNVKTTAEGRMLRDKLVVDEGMRTGGSPRSARGLHLFADFGFGGMTGGGQSRSGLVTEEGKEASTSKAGLSLGMRWFFSEYAGLHARTGILWGQATAPNVKPMNFTDAWSSDLGLVLVPWRGEAGIGTLQLVLGGGLNFTRLTIAQDYQDFIEANQDFTFFDDAAAGFGWYAGPEFQIIMRGGFLLRTEVRFLQENPQFPKGNKPFDGSQILGGMGLGYAF
jgi:hypothetical protein